MLYEHAGHLQVVVCEVMQEDLGSEVKVKDKHLIHCLSSILRRNLL